MAAKLNKRKESNLLFLKKDSNYFSSISSLNSQLSPNFHLNNFTKKDITNSKKVNNHMNNITKINTLIEIAYLLKFDNECLYK